jgi:hypothetical protein
LDVFEPLITISKAQISLNKKFGKIFSFQTNPSVVTMQLTTKPHNFTLCKKERKEKGPSLNALLNSGLLTFSLKS